MCADAYVHPNGICESSNVGPGTRIWAFAHVLRGAVIGADCNISEGCFVEDGAVLGDRVVVKNGVAVWSGVTLENDVFVGPAATFTNDLLPRAAPYRTPRENWLPTLVQVGACLGANSTIVCGIVVRAHALVAAGSVVTRDVQSHSLVAGNPARPVGWICRCGERLRVTADRSSCVTCGRTYDLAATGLEAVDHAS